MAQKGVNVNPIDNFEMTPYHDAMIHRHSEAAALLKQHHGTVVHRDLGFKLCAAAYEGNKDHLNALLDHGAILDTADYDLRTALHLAACENRIECVKWLLQKGVDRKVKDCFGNTPLHDAERYNHYAVINLLKEENSDFLINASNIDSLQKPLL